jgi:hypothetical protein
MTWKQTVFYGYYMGEDTNAIYNEFYDIIITLSENKTTHLILEFIICQSPAYELILYDTVRAWTLLSSQQQQDLQTHAKNNNINIMFSFGGATSFSDSSGFLGLVDSVPVETLTDQLLTILNDNNMIEIDLDIENINASSYNDPNNIKMYEYLGELSKLIKNNAQNPSKPIIVCHAPQTPYYNLSLYGFIYNSLEYYYGEYIDFYNIQFYNQGSGAYLLFEQIFIDDDYQIASVLQLINATSTINGFYGEGTVTNNFTTPANKICVGKTSYNEGGSTSGYVILYDGSTTSNTMTNYVNKVYNYSGITSTQQQQLNDWFINGGIMVWVYLTNNDIAIAPPGTNENILNYFSFNTGGTCFVKGTKILTFTDNIEKEINIEDLKIDNLVKIHTGEYKKIVFIGYNIYRKKDFKNIKVLKQNKIKDDIPNNDLYLTTGHSLLFDELLDEYKNEHYNIHFYPENEKIDNFTKIMSQHCKLFEDIDTQKEDIIFYFHIALENDDIFGQYGIYANNILCESMSINHIDNSKLISL